MLGKVLITVTLLVTIVAPVLADWNESHLFSPEWPPHARFHDVTYLCAAVGFSLVGLWLLWRHSLEPEIGVTVAALVPVFTMGSFYIAEAVPGSHFEDHAGQVPRVLGVPINLLMAAIVPAISLVGWLCYRITKVPVTSRPVTGGNRNWIDFASQECHFKVSFPQWPETETDSDAYRYSSETGECGFAIRFSGELSIDSSDQTLERVLDLAVSERNGELLAHKKIGLGKLRGIEYLIKAKEPDRYVRGRVYVVHSNHLCQLNVTSSNKGPVNGEDADRFLDSFTPTE